MQPRRTHGWKNLLLASVVLLMLAVRVGATDVWDSTSPNDDTPGNTRNVLRPGDSQRHDVETKAGPTADQDWFRLVVTAGHSYEVRVGGRQDDCFDFGALANFRVFTSDGTTPITAGEDEDFTGIISSFRATFVAPSNLNVFVQLIGRDVAGVANCTAASEYTISFLDTTLINPAWSSFGTFDTFYSIHNAGSTMVNGTFKMFDTTGAELVSVPVSIGPGLTFSTNTQPSGLNVPRNKNGAARFTHDGSPGSLIAEAAIANFTTPPGVIQPVRFQVIPQGN